MNPGLPQHASPACPRGKLFRRSPYESHRPHHPQRQRHPPGKLADAELHFTGGELDGLKLIGFSIWERRGGGGRNVTFPARQYVVNGEKRTFALLRPITDVSAQDRIRDLVLQAFDEHDERSAIAANG